MRRRPRPTLQPRAKGIEPPTPTTMQFLREALEYEPKTGALVWSDSGRTAWHVNANRPVIYFTVNQHQPQTVPARLVCWYLLTGFWPRFAIRAVNPARPLDLRAENLRTCPGRGNDQLAETGARHVK